MNESTAFLSRMVDVQIDRSLESRHPKHGDTVYAVNHGFVPGTMRPDGEAIAELKACLFDRDIVRDSEGGLLDDLVNEAIADDRARRAKLR